jgi:hypothetical protein
LAGATSAGAVVGASGLKLPQGVKAETLTAMGQAMAGEAPLRARAAACFSDLVKVDELIKHVKEVADAEDNTPDEQPKGTGTGGQNALDASAESGRAVRRGQGGDRACSPCRSVASTRTRREGTATRHCWASWIGPLAPSGNGWLNGRGKDVVMLVYSEFGRAGQGERVGRDRPRHRLKHVPDRRQPSKVDCTGAQPSLHDWTTAT